MATHCSQAGVHRPCTSPTDSTHSRCEEKKKKATHYSQIGIHKKNNNKKATHCSRAGSHWPCTSPPDSTHSRCDHALRRWWGAWSPRPRCSPACSGPTRAAHPTTSATTGNKNFVNLYFKMKNNEQFFSLIKIEVKLKYILTISATTKKLLIFYFQMKNNLQFFSLKKIKVKLKYIFLIEIMK